MKTLVIQLCFVLLLTNAVFTQNNITPKLFEAQGSALYSYSNQVRPPDQFLPIERFERYTLMSFQPSFGFFLSSHLEVFVQPSYSYSKFEANDVLEIDASGSKRYLESISITRTYNLGLSGGLAYHVSLNQSIVSFLALSVGWRWSTWSYDTPPGEVYQFPWPTPAVIFPNVAGGLKIFFADTWALIPQAQWSRTSLSSHDYFSRETLLSFGVGFSIYFNHTTGE
jgi:hypothetical protein